MSQHPYHHLQQGRACPNLQQSHFPSWHNRRYSPAADMILEGGRRKNGSFDALQQIVNERQQQDNDLKRQLSGGDRGKQAQHQFNSTRSNGNGANNDNVDNYLAVNGNTSRKIAHMVKDTTSGPAVIIHGPSSDTTTFRSTTAEGESDNYASTPHAANCTEATGADNFLKISN